MAFISLNNITIRTGEKFLFKNTSLQLEKADNLLVVGANGSGKTTLVKAIAGLLPVSKGEIILEFLKNDPLPYPFVHKDKIAYISFESHKKIHQQNELLKDLEGFSGKKKKTFNLSTGETRKLIIEKALSKNPAILILDEPYDGLDVNFKKEFKRVIEKLSKKCFLILVTHRLDEVFKNIKKALLVENGEIKKIGNIKDVLNEYRLFQSKRKSVKAIKEAGKKGDKVLIDFQNVSVKFGNRKILKDINWQVKEGGNWAILGPNGAGKSTLIKLITGENLQVFANKIKIFGKSRSELDVEELNKKIGLVSPDLSLRINDKTLVSKIIGLKNSKLVSKLGISDLLEKKYGELSFGQKRLVLIARGLVKNPKILILDEPFHGLDSKNRIKILDEIENITQSKTTVILITHNEDEISPSITSIMHLKNGRVVG